MGHHHMIRPSEDAVAREAKVALLNARLQDASAADVLHAALAETGRIALVSSFGADSVVLLHMLSRIDRHAPVIFIDTEMLFPETLAYQREVGETLGLRDVRVIRGADSGVADPDGTLHLRDPDACCALRKTRPLDRALAPFDAWITGRKRFQSGQRARLTPFEVEPGTGRIKVNPLAAWTPHDTSDYIAAHDLPRHPLVARGYPSIGCAPCTSPVAEGEDTRAGRWRGRDKDECGIHFIDGRAVRAGVSR
jgi:phosphoadenosine phosphosulfate reductase